MAILGLISSDKLEATRSENYRRRVFYDYPNGKFPLMGLLSLMEDAEELIDPTFGWWEEEYKSTRDRTVATEVAKGPFATNDAGGTAAADATKAIDTTVYLQLVDASRFRVRDVIRVKDVVATDSATLLQVTAQVTGVRTDTNVLTLKILDTSLTTLGAINAASILNNGLYVTAIGTASTEGDRSRSDGRTEDPFQVFNYTQIFRTTLPLFTGSAIKMGQRFDSSGRYKKAAKDTCLRHMELMEKTAFFGKARATMGTNADGDSVPIKYAGGIEYFLTQWDIGNTVNGGVINYRPGGDNLTSVDWNNYEEKRVIRNIGTITTSQWDELVRRMFMSQSDTSFEKLVICGDKTLAIVNTWVKSQSLATRTLTSKEDSYGLQIVQVDTIHGSLLFKTHPLFKEDPSLQNSMFVVDMGDIVYHNLMDRDTELLKNRQARDADYRKDEYLTEATFEVRRAKRHMFITGLTGIRS